MRIDRKFWSGSFSRSYAPLNLENSKYLLLSLWALLLKLLNRISWNLVVIMDIICKLVICLLSHFIHIWYLDWPWSEHAHIIPISRMVDFCESYSPFHVLLRAAAINYFLPHAPTYWTLKRDNSSMEHNSWKNQDIRISSQYAHLHIMSLLATKFHKIMFCSFTVSVVYIAKFISSKGHNPEKNNLETW
jgi:hypothetical protein